MTSTDRGRTRRSASSSPTWPASHSRLAVLAIYDKALEYISGGSNVEEIKAFFWKWRRSHNPNTECSLLRCFDNIRPVEHSPYARSRRVWRERGGGGGGRR